MYGGLNSLMGGCPHSRGLSSQGAALPLGGLSSLMVVFLCCISLPTATFPSRAGRSMSRGKKGTHKDTLCPSSATLQLFLIPGARQRATLPGFHQGPPEGPLEALRKAGHCPGMEIALPEQSQPQALGPGGSGLAVLSPALLARSGRRPQRAAPLFKLCPTQCVLVTRFPPRLSEPTSCLS